MNGKPLNILFIEDNPGDFLLVSEYLRLGNLPVQKIIQSEKLSSIKERIGDTVVNFIFLDLSLPDSSGEATVEAVSNMFPSVPLVVLSGLDNLQVSLNAIAFGAQDYLIKGDFDEKTLEKVVQYSIERKRVSEILRENEERFEILINKATHDIVWDYNIPEDTIIRGAAIYTLLGIKPEQIDEKSSSIYEFVHPEDLDHLKNKFLEAINNKRESWQDEYRLIASDNTLKYILDRGYIIYNDRSEPVRMIGAMTDLTTIRQLEREIAEQRLNEQKLITQTALSAQEREKNQIGKELHDNINQILATVKIYLGIIKNNKSEDTEALLQQCQEYVSLAISEIRNLSHSLVTPSLGEVSLQNSVRKLADNFNTAGQFLVTEHFELNEHYTANKEKELTLYRVLQEQMNNIQKYAKAKNVEIRIKNDEQHVFMEIRDDGVGFDPSSKAGGIGIRNMKGRVEFHNGDFTIDSAPGKGCRINISIPL